MASLWYCCGCKFGPHNSALYDACINCGAHRCDECVDEKVANRLSSHAHSDCNHTVSPYPSAVAVSSSSISLSTRTMPPSAVTDLPQIRPLSRHRPGAPGLSFEAGTHVYGATYMYICCRCDDGPKVYNVQPQCVICHHEACSSCTYVK